MRQLLAIFCAGVLAAANAGDFNAIDSVQMRGVVMPLYAKLDRSPVANVRIGCVYPDHARKGFFRIGLFPILAGEDVHVEVLQGRRALRALARLQERFSAKQRRAVEWRNVTFTFSGQPRMHVGRVRMMNEERWELLDGVRIEGATEAVWPKAVLFLAGPDAGDVKSGSNSIELFRKEP